MYGAESDDDYCTRATIVLNGPCEPLFQTFRKKKLPPGTMSRSEASRMIRRRAVDAGLFAPVCCHSYRATGITNYLEGTLETAQKIAAHEEPRTTKLYDRTDDQLTLGMVSEGSRGILSRNLEIK